MSFQNHFLAGLRIDLRAQVSDPPNFAIIGIFAFWSVKNQPPAFGFLLSAFSLLPAPNP
jgi:hypothetical protein